MGVVALSAPVTKEEVKEAKFAMQSYRAPGPDGFIPFFFKHFWEVVGNDVWGLVNNSFRRGHIEDNITETLLVLIPKENNLTHLNKFRLISLCNVIFKVITKVLMNRIYPPFS